MTITEQINAWKKETGMGNPPADFEKFWKMRLKNAAPEKIMRETVPFENPAAVYEAVTVGAVNGQQVHLRYIRPRKGSSFPTVLMFHDLGRGPRGWHHMSRFAGLGFAVLALENPQRCSLDWQQTADELPWEQFYIHALTTLQTALVLEETDKSRLFTWGEGFGGALAIVSAALSEIPIDCAALHPFPSNTDTLFGADSARLAYYDLRHFAKLLHGRFLMGTAMQDKIAPPKSQFALFNNAACEKIHKIYPKHEHERVNFFENELLKFFGEGLTLRR